MTDLPGLGRLLRSDPPVAPRPRRELEKRWQKRRSRRLGSAALALVVAGSVATAALVSHSSASGHLRVIAPPAVSLPTVVGGPTRPTALAVGSGGLLYIADPERDQILERAADGRFFVVVGNGKAGFSGDGGPAVRAEINNPSGMAVASDGTLYFADQDNGRVRAVAPDGTIRTIAGDGGFGSGFVTTGTPALRAAISPTDVTFGPQGRLYIAAGNQVLRQEADGTLTVVAGAPGPYEGLYGLGGPATSGSADGPDGIAFDSAGNLYITGSNTKSLLMVTPDGLLTQPAGTHDLYPRGDGGVASRPGGSILAMGELDILSIGPSTTKTVISFMGGTFHGIKSFSPNGIAVGRDGTIYVDTFYGNGYTDRSAIAAISADGRDSKILWEGLSPSTVSGSTGRPAQATTVRLNGNGVGNVDFGEAETPAVRHLTDLVGPGRLVGGLQDCGIDTDVQFQTLTTYFDNGHFVGYSTLAANGETLSGGGAATAAGLRVGDSLADGERTYGSAFSTSEQQGGAWFVATETGRLEGYLTQEPGQTNPAPQIESIEAGVVGCAAATP